MTANRLPLGMTDGQALEARLGCLLTASAVRGLRRLNAEALAARVADGRLIAVTLPDGTAAFPAYQFTRRRAPGTVLAARQAFADIDPSGALAASWLTSSVAPNGWPWRDLDAHIAREGGLEVVLALARLDATRCAEPRSSPLTYGDAASGDHRSLTRSVTPSGYVRPVPR